MYFENPILNVLVILLIISFFSFINYLLNKHARLLMNYKSSLNLNSEELIKKYSKDKKVPINSYPSNANNDLDNYNDKNKCIFINSRHYYSTSIYTIARTVYFASMSIIAKNNNSSYKLQSLSDFVFTMLDILSYGMILIGLLLKINILIILGIVLLFISFIFILINYKTIKLYINESINYLSKILNDKNELNAIKAIYKYELYSYLFKPFTSIIKLFPFLLSINQKKLNIKEQHYE